jgi:hypothetical protein
VPDRYQDPYDFRTPEQKRRAARRRLLYLAIGGVLVLASAQRLVQPAVNGWFSSVEVLRLQQEIKETNTECGDLQQQVAFLDTTEGRDVEAKKQELRGPPGETLIRVRAKAQSEKADGPVGFGDRAQDWLTAIGERTLDGVRYVWRVLEYWFGGEGRQVQSGSAADPPQEAS